MKSSLILLLSVCYIGYTTGAPKPKICNSVNKADTCMQKLLLLGDPKFKFPLDKKEMDAHCKYDNHWKVILFEILINFINFSELYQRRRNALKTIRVNAWIPSPVRWQVSWLSVWPKRTRAIAPAWSARKNSLESVLAVTPSKRAETNVWVIISILCWALKTRKTPRRKYPWFAGKFK